MLSLIVKDFKLLFQGTSRNKWGQVLSILFTILTGAIFIVIEVFLFNAIFSNLKSINRANASYFTVFLFIISSLLTVFCLFTAKKLFFNEEDNTKLKALPVSSSQILLSKIFFLFITMYFMNIVFTYPLFITYGVIYRKMATFFFTALFYPVILFFFQAGIALLLVYPFKLLLDFFKKHIGWQFVTVVAIAFGLTYLYSSALDIFVNLVAENNIDSLFTIKTLNAVDQAAKFMFPVNILENVFVNNRVTLLIPAIIICGGVFAVGLAVGSYYYNKLLQNVFYENKKEIKDIKLKSTTPGKALFKKEMILLFRDSNFIFSFTGLLMIEPLLSYLIIRSLDTVFTSGALAYSLSAVPNIITFLNVMLMMLISAIIYQGANNYISNEQKAVRLMKTIPVSPIKQLAIKVAIPLVLSLAFLLVSYLVLFLMGLLKIIAVLYAVLMNVLFIIVLALVSLFEELGVKHNQEKNVIISTIYTYVVPFLYFGVALLLCYYKVNYNFIFLIGLGVVILSLLPYVIKFKSRINDKFLSLEVYN